MARRETWSHGESFALEAGDELLFVTSAESEALVQQAFSPHSPPEALPPQVPEQHQARADHLDADEDAAEAPSSGSGS